MQDCPMSPAAAEAEYAQAIEDFDALRQILPKFRRERVCLRDTDYFSSRIRSFVRPGVRITQGVRRDFAVCALANKGCNTHASVRILTDAGSGDDAMVLARVLLETAVIFRWMMIDQPYRLDLYCLSSALFKRRWTQLVAQHFSREPDVVATANAALTAEDSAMVEAAFGNVQYRWARERQSDGKFVDYSFEVMLKDIEKAEGTSATTDFMYNVSYFLHSAHAHATADGMRQFKTLGREQFFSSELGFNSGNCTMALQGANTYLCWLLGHVSAYLGLLETLKPSWISGLRKSARDKAGRRNRR
jgi:hypothetical protein